MTSLKFVVMLCRVVRKYHCLCPVCRNMSRDAFVNRRSLFRFMQGMSCTDEAVQTVVNVMQRESGAVHFQHIFFMKVMNLAKILRGTF